MRTEKSELPLRIVVRDPVPGVVLALQCGATGRATLIGPVEASAEELAFDLAVTLDGCTGDGAPRLLGPFVQGPPAARFVYVNVGAAAGQPGSVWNRRAKVPLGGIDWPLIEEVRAGCRLVADIHGRARDGGPACATVPLLAPGWRLVLSPP